MFSILKKVQQEAQDAEALAHIVSLRAKHHARMGVDEFLYFARLNNIPALYLHALFATESSGNGFNEDGRLLVCAEPHKAYKNALGDAKLLHQQYPDLFYPKWKGMRSPVYKLSQNERWQHIISAAEKDYHGGLCGASYGAGQQVGEDWKALGFDSITEFIETLYQGQFTHLEVMLRKLKLGDQLDNLRKGIIRPVVAFYNGDGNVPEYEKRFLNNIKLKRPLYA